MALEIKLTGTPFRYVQSLDKPTRDRIKKKLEQIAEDPTDSRLSYPLTNSQKRSTRVGTYRILFEIDEKTLTVADVGPRTGHVARSTAKRKFMIMQIQLIAVFNTLELMTDEMERTSLIAGLNDMHMGKTRPFEEIEAELENRK